MISLIPCLPLNAFRILLSSVNKFFFDFVNRLQMHLSFFMSFEHGLAKHVDAASRQESDRSVLVHTVCKGRKKISLQETPKERVWPVAHAKMNFKNVNNGASIFSKNTSFPGIGILHEGLTQT